LRDCEVIIDKMTDFYGKTVSVRDQDGNELFRGVIGISNDFEWEDADLDSHSQVQMAQNLYKTSLIESAENEAVT
jgi:hypothetical protein